MTAKKKINRDNITRRDFAKGAVGATLLAGPAINVLGANEKIALGVIGCGNRGNYVLSLFQRNSDIRVLSICDVDDAKLKTVLDKQFSGPGDKPTTTKDFRTIIEDPEVQALLIATPDHWHAIPFVMACNTGKDVYCEKPLATSIYEGQKMVEAAHKNKRVTQIGTQQRSNEHFQEAVKMVRDGYLGKLVNIECWNVDRRLERNMGYPPDSDPPAGVDYNMWLGPAPKRPFNPNRFHGKFRWFWDYSGGQITDWGTHLLDIVQWTFNEQYPLSITASGGKYAIPDNRETPDTMNVLYEYPGDVLVHYFFRMCSAPDFYGKGYGTTYYGTDGTLFINRQGYEVTPLSSKVAARSKRARDLTDGHVNEFVRNIKTRQLCISDVGVTHRSTAVSHLGNIALWSKEKLHWDGQSERIINHPDLNRYLRREYREPWVL